MLTRRQRRELAQFQSRHGRRKTDLMLVEGICCCEEALRRRPDLLSFSVLSASFAASAASAPLRSLLAGLSCIPETVDDAEFAELAATESPQGVLCVFRRPVVEAAPVARPPFALILDRIQEPGNLGTMLRTAWAVGLRSVWLTKGSADPYSPKVIRSGMGAQFAVELAVVEDLAAARELLERAGGGPLWLAVPDGGTSCFEDGFDLRGGGLVIGNEGGGIADLSVGRQVSIPMPGNAESLNAAQAATVLLFDAVRRGIMGGSHKHGNE